MIGALTEENYVNFAMKCYDNPDCHLLEDFQEDLNRVKYVKVLLKRYLAHGVLRERLILNHLIILMNVFGTENALKMLFLKVPENSLHVLRSFLEYMRVLPQSELSDSIVTEKLAEI